MLTEQPVDPYGYVRNLRAAFDRSGWWHSFELPDGSMIEGVSKLPAQKMRIGQFPIPERLDGKRVLDVGTWDGWFATEMERRGAEVMAIDRFENPRFLEIRELLNSKIDYRHLSVYDLDPDRIGRFDIVLFMGVLYHLKHPLLALEKVCSVAKDLVAVESFVLRDRHAHGLSVEDRPLMEFFENDEFGGEFDNWVAPTVPCLMSFCRTAGVELNNVHEYGAAITCHRTWPPSAPRKQLLDLRSAFHTDGGINFQSDSSEEYVCCLVSAPGVELTKDSVRAEVNGYAADPVHVGAVEGGSQVTFKLPPGLSAGWHPVQLMTDAAESNTVEIAVDLPLLADAVKIQSVCDGVSWKVSETSLANGFLSLWVRGLPRHADRHNVKLKIAGRRLMVTYVGASTADGVSQINARIHPNTPPGAQELTLQFGELTDSTSLTITP
jgi:tRNA (mo5U34)-methyltransferase